ncbi:MAG TPA: beta-propeller fold lactonase family protein, partial [Vicinamibacterales bacterium]|nr:beta-propeller fold lactonase family protein [Vicinamibacterales bacterium]
MKDFPVTPYVLKRPYESRKSFVAPGLARIVLCAVSLCTAVTAAADGEQSAAENWDRGGVVYAMTNAASGNQILVYVRDATGRLRHLPGATASTHGAGGSVTAAVDPLGSQGSLVYDETSQMLFAVNAGDNTVTAFDTGAVGFPLRVQARVASGGFIPVSLAVSGNILYVLNAGGTGSVTTFTIGNDGTLSQAASLDLGLPPSATAPPFDQIAAPGQVGVDALARHLIVTHAGGQEMLVVSLDDDGVPSGPIVSTHTPGAGTFSFGVTRYGTLLVAEAASASVSAFDPPSGTQPLVPTASAIGTGQSATCWIVVHEDGYAYVANTGSNTLSRYR